MISSFSQRVFAQDHPSLPEPSGPSENKVDLQNLFQNTLRDSLQGNQEKPVELTGDQVEFLHAENKVIAKGHVVVVKGDITLKCDQVEFSRATQIAVAEGHVVLISSQETIVGEKMIYNFQKMTGEFMDAKIFSHPFYGASQKATKLEGNHIRMDQGYLTTCDHDKPHFRLAPKKLDLYPHDKMIARGVRMMVGGVPVAYLPRYSQVLDDKRPQLTYVPGRSKAWGMFLLADLRYYVNENLRTNFKLDFREKKDIAWGVNAKYSVPRHGAGVFRTYYMKERSITSKRFYKPRPGPTPEHERLKVEWRHKWTIDPKTEAVWQYYKLSDNIILKEYFPREYKQDPTARTFFVLTHNLEKSTLSFQYEQRVNRFTSVVERLPEIRWDLPSQKLGATNFYFKSLNAYSNLSKKDASPTEIRRETMRVDSENELSYPLRILRFLELKPFAGWRETYYSKTAQPAQYGVLRGVFSTGADLTTKFYKVYDVKTTILGMELNRLRHLITPSVAYLYRRDPTLSSSVLDNFDGVDSIQRDHTIGLSLENKLQTKRNKKIVDLLRAIVSTDFRLRDHIEKGGFDQVRTDVELRPTDWLEFHSNTNYNTFLDHLDSANFDFYLRDIEKWSFGLGKRYQREGDDQITAQLYYKINPKWKFKIYERFDVNGGGLKEQEYTISRDLHEWEMEINFNEFRGQGSEIWLIFRLKAFPDNTIDLGGATFNQRKIGSQGFETPPPQQTPTSQ